MTILMKEVVIIKILGAKVKIVNQITIWIPFVKSCGVLAGCIPIFIFGNETGAAQAGITVKNDIKKPNSIYFNFLFISLTIPIKK